MALKHYVMSALTTAVICNVWVLLSQLQIAKVGEKHSAVFGILALFSEYFYKGI